jgi:hypothetical protein
MTQMKALFTPQRLLKAFALACAFVGIYYAVQQNETAREVVGDAFAGLFGFFTTPFILEISVALIGLITVVSYNQWRLSQEGDGWVTLPESDESPETLLESTPSSSGKDSL